MSRPELLLDSLTPEQRARLLKRLAERAAAAGDRAADALRPRARGPRDPLSFAQERLWFLAQLEPDSAAYHVPFAVRLRGALEPAALRAAWREILRRHEVLRTTFQAVDGVPCQRVHDMDWADAGAALAERRLAPGPEEERTRRVDACIAELVLAPFDLERGPLARALLLALAPDEHILALCLHHTVTDGGSMRLLLRELAALYRAFAQGRPSPLPELPLQYADYALWQREMLAGDRLQRQIAYWIGRLAGAPPILELPTDHPRPPMFTGSGASHVFGIKLGDVQELRVLARREECTLFMALLAAVGALMARYSGQDELVLGSPISGRPRTALEPLIGLFVNTLALRLDLSGDPSFCELLRRARETALGAFAHPDLPFERVVEELRAPRDLTRSPLFQVMLLLQDQAAPIPQQGDLTIEPVEGHKGTAKFDLTFSFSETADRGLVARIVYADALWSADSIARMAGHLAALLGQVTRTPEAPLSAVELLTPPERRQVLGSWAATDRPYALRPIHRLFEAQAAATPRSPALECGGEHLTYAELDALANRLAGALAACEVGPEVRVGVLLEREPALVAALLAVLKAGGCYVPLDATYPLPRIAYMVADSRAALVVTRGALRDRLPADVPLLDLDAPLPPNLTQTTAPVAPDNLAYVIYTSGSTGGPKGVAIAHRSASAFLGWAHATFSPAELARVLAATSVCFDLSIFELFAPLTCGGTVVLVPDVLALREQGTPAGLTLVNAVPSAMEALLAGGGLPAGGPTVVLAGEPLTQALVRRLYALGARRVLDCYGPSETTTYSTWAERRPEGAATIGRPISNTRAFVLDRHGAVTPVGVPGELYLAGDGLARGYLDRPGLTASRFLPDPFAPGPGGRLYRTGDVARWTAGGELEFLGRADHQVKVHGYRIELGEVEAALRDQPGVREAVVLARRSGSERTLVAYVAIDAHLGADEAAALPRRAERALRLKLPGYMVPGRILVREALPRTANGKLDRKALAAETEPASATGAFVKPRTEEECLVAAVWEEVLGQGPVGADDDFFERGGHSLLAVRLLASLERATGRKLPLASLFQAPTVAGQARLLAAAAQPAPWSPLVPLRTTGRELPFFAVHPMAGDVLCYRELARLLGPEQPFYALQARGLDGTSEPLASVEKLATSYLLAVHSVQTRGPYRLGGWSFGGVVAFEMARQLRRQGEAVEPLVLLDSAAPTPRRRLRRSATPGRAAWGRWFQELSADVERVFGRPLAGTFAQLHGLAEAEQAERFARILTEAGVLPDGAGSSLARGFWRVHRANVLALWRYAGHAPRLGSAVTLLRATEGRGGARGRGALRPPWAPARDLGWGRAVDGPVQVVPVPGDHYHLLSWPFVESLAREVHRCLEAAR